MSTISQAQLERIRERAQKMIAQNRKARFDYHIVESMEAGIMLTGTEVKSIRKGKCNLQDSYAMFEGKTNPELFVLGMHISPFEQGNIFNHVPLRKRKLLLKKTQLEKLRKRTEEKGYALVPLAVYLSGSYVKIELGIAKGKKQFDKRATMKERDVSRAMRRGDDE